MTSMDQDEFIAIGEKPREDKTQLEHSLLEDLFRISRLYPTTDACKDLVSAGKLEIRNGAYSIPVQLSIFMELSL